jgi:hypothetical protein
MMGSLNVTLKKRKCQYLQSELLLHNHKTQHLAFRFWNIYKH